MGGQFPISSAAPEWSWELILFTEHGILMLSSVLNSKRAIQVNIQIMRIFVKIKEIIVSHKDLAKKIEELESRFQERFNEYDEKFILIFKAIKELLEIKEDEAKNKGSWEFQAPKKGNGIG